MLIKLSEGHSVAPESISEVRIRDHSDGVSVVMKSGTVHFVRNDYKKDPYTTHDRLVKEINEARAACPITTAA